MRKYKIVGGGCLSMHDIETKINELLNKRWDILAITDSSRGMLVHLIKNNCEYEKEEE